MALSELGCPIIRVLHACPELNRVGFSSMPIVLIIGASRGIGLTAVKIGLSAGYEVRLSLIHI